MKDYKFEIGQIVPIVVVLAVAGLVIAFTSQIGGDVRDDIGDSTCASRTDGYTSYVESTKMCYNGSDSLAPSSHEFNATGKMLEANTKFADKLPLIATVIVAVILIGIIIKYFKGD